MANLSYQNYTGDGVTTTYAISINYIDSSHIKASLNGMDTTAFIISGSNLIFSTAPANLDVIKIYRDTPRTLAGRLVDFTSSSVLSESDLDTSAIQLLYIAQEAYERGGDSGLVYLTYSDALIAFDANSNRITQLAAPTSGSDAVNKTYADANSLDKSSGQWDAGSVRVINIATPVAAADAATKDYVDSIVTWGVAGNAQSLEITTTSGIGTYTLTGMEYVVADMLVVSRQGNLQMPVTEFTVTSGSPNSTITLVGSVAAGEKLIVLNFGKKLFVPATSIDDESITTAKLADEAVTLLKMAPDSVDSDQIRDGSISNLKMAADSIATTNIQDNAVDSNKLADNAVDTAAIQALAIDWSKMMDTGFFTVGTPTTTDLYLTVNKTSGKLELKVINYNDINNITLYPTNTSIDKFAVAQADVQISSSTTHPTKKITAVSTPTNDFDAATKKYVDDTIGTNLKPGTLISNVTLAAAATTLVAENIYDTGQYKRFQVVLNNILCNVSESTTLQLRIKDQSAGTWTGSYNWSNHIVAVLSPSSVFASGLSSSKIQICNLLNSSRPISGIIDIHLPTVGTDAPLLSGKCLSIASGATHSQGYPDFTFGLIDGVEISLGSGNAMAIGSNIKIYGFEE